MLFTANRELIVLRALVRPKRNQAHAWSMAKMHAWSQQRSCTVCTWVASRCECGTQWSLVSYAADTRVRKALSQMSRAHHMRAPWSCFLTQCTKLQRSHALYAVCVCARGSMRDNQIIVRVRVRTCCTVSPYDARSMFSCIRRFCV